MQGVVTKASAFETTAATETCSTESSLSSTLERLLIICHFDESAKHVHTHPSQ